MSKAIIQNLAAQEKAYRSLNEALSRHQNVAAEVEVIPPEYGSNDQLLEEGNSLGIPKLLFVAAFVRARDIFQKGAKDNFEQVSQCKPSGSVSPRFDYTKDFDS